MEKKWYLNTLNVKKTLTLNAQCISVFAIPGQIFEVLA